MDDRETIERRREEYINAFNREDIAGLELCCSEDTLSMGPNRPTVRGIEAQRAVWREGFAAAKSLLFIFPEELELTGDIAIDRHRWVLDSLPKRGGRPVHDEGKAVWIWRRSADGNWTVTRSIWNSDLARGGYLSALGSELSEDLASINRLLDLFVGAVCSGDVKAWADLMTEDLIFSVPGAPRFVGRDSAVAAAKAAFFEPFALRLASKFEDVQVFGTHGFAHGIFTMDMMPRAGGKMISAPGQFTNFFRKEADGSWKYAHVIFNYDQTPG